MSKFLETIKAVKDENLDKGQLEHYHKILCELKGEMKLELAGILKKKALFLGNNPDWTVAQRRINWGMTEEGQREIDLKAYIGAVNSNLEGTKARLFSIY